MTHEVSYTATWLDCGPEHRLLFVHFPESGACTLAGQRVEDMAEYMQAWRLRRRRLDRRAALLSDNLPR